MTPDFVKTAPIQALLDKASGTEQEGGDARLKAIIRDLVEATMTAIVKYDIDEGEFWQAIGFLQSAAPEFGLIAPGIGLEHFLDLYMDAKDSEAGLSGGTPRTIEGPLYVEGAPLVQGDVNLTSDADETDTLYMTGRVTGPDGEPVTDVTMHVWHANSKGFYSHFDPTGEQTPFNNRRRIKLGADGRYSFRSKMPNGYAVPPGGSTDRGIASSRRRSISVTTPSPPTISPSARAKACFRCRAAKATAPMWRSISCCSARNLPTTRAFRPVPARPPETRPWRKSSPPPQPRSTASCSTE
jgi:catechol 1,2-dioxygenase